MCPFLVLGLRGRIEIVRDGVLEVVSFPTPLSVRSAEGDVNVDDAVRRLKASPNISRDFHANKLRDFIRESDSVLNVIKYQNQLNILARTSSTGTPRPYRRKIGMCSVDTWCIRRYAYFAFV